MSIFIRQLVHTQVLEYIYTQVLKYVSTYGVAATLIPVLTTVVLGKLRFAYGYFLDGLTTSGRLIVTLVTVTTRQGFFFLPHVALEG